MIGFRHDNQKGTKVGITLGNTNQPILYGVHLNGPLKERYPAVKHGVSQFDQSSALRHLAFIHCLAPLISTGLILVPRLDRSQRFYTHESQTVSRRSQYNLNYSPYSNR
ncbi:hypothetical protein PSP31120_04444 [Pandoraea sputorum]|nr:hypothetical protein PSP31120_04444 [Pandoraea sputorum]